MMTRADINRNYVRPDITPETIIEYFSIRGGVSFVELQNYFEGVKGDFDWGNAKLNIWFWFGMSEQSIRVLQSALDTDVLKMTPTSLFVYLADGSIPRVPIAKRVQKYKTERWVPVVFNRGEGFPS